MNLGYEEKRFRSSQKYTKLTSEEKNILFWLSLILSFKRKHRSRCLWNEKLKPEVGIQGTVVMAQERGVSCCWGWYCWWFRNLPPGTSWGDPENQREVESNGLYQLVLTTRRYPSKPTQSYPTLLLRDSEKKTTEWINQDFAQIAVGYSPLWGKSIKKWNNSLGHLLGAFFKTTCW